MHVIPSREDGEGPHEILREFERSFAYAQDDSVELARAAETAPRFGASDRNGAIHVHGAREHNLKNIDLKIPREKLVVITGLSGSGKSTVAFDILFAEGQRRFLDSMSPYARQFVEQLEKPDVDLVSGLPPTVAIEQRVTRGGGKSTVATVTEVYHFLRLLFAKTGTQFCPDCDLPVEKQSAASIVKQIETAAKRGPLKVLAPLVKARKGFHTDVARWAERQGFDTLYVDGKLVPVAQFRKLERFKEHTIDVVVGVIDRRRIASAREITRRALEIGRGTARLLDSRNRLTVVSTEMSCPNCGRAFEELDPRLFSFNSPHGMCEECGGFGEIWDQRCANGSEPRWRICSGKRVGRRTRIRMDRRRRSARMSKLSRLAFERGGASCARARLYHRSIHGSLGGRSSARDREAKIQRERSDGSRRSHSRDSTATAFHGDRRTRLSRAWALGKNFEWR